MASLAVRRHRSRSSADSIINLVQSLDENDVHLLLSDLNNTTEGNVAVAQAINFFQRPAPHHLQHPHRRFLDHPDLAIGRRQPCPPSDTTSIPPRADAKIFSISRDQRVVSAPLSSPGALRAAPPCLQSDVPSCVVDPNAPASARQFDAPEDMAVPMPSSLASPLMSPDVTACDPTTSVPKPPQSTEPVSTELSAPPSSHLPNTSLSLPHPTLATIKPRAYKRISRPLLTVTSAGYGDALESDHDLRASILAAHLFGNASALQPPRSPLRGPRSLVDLRRQQRNEEFGLDEHGVLTWDHSPFDSREVSPPMDSLLEVLHTRPVRGHVSRG